MSKLFKTLCDSAPSRLCVKTPLPKITFCFENLAFRKLVVGDRIRKSFLDGKRAELAFFRERDETDLKGFRLFRVAFDDSPDGFFASLFRRVAEAHQLDD